MKAVLVNSWDEFFDAEAGAVFQATDVTDEENPHAVWHTKPPCGHMGTLVPPEKPNEEGKFHTVNVDDADRITVDPSIQCTAEENCWHGWLRNSVWEG